MNNSLRNTKSRIDVVELVGLAADFSDLPTNVPTGSTFFEIDTGKVYMFEETDSTWYEI